MLQDAFVLLRGIRASNISFHLAHPNSRAIIKLMHMIDPLEPRFLLSASLSKGTLRVAGGSGSDTISVSLHNHAYNVNINGVKSTFAASSVRSLLGRGNDGNDQITLSGPINAPHTVNGNDG